MRGEDESTLSFFFLFSNNYRGQWGSPREVGEVELCACSLKKRTGSSDPTAGNPGFGWFDPLGGRSALPRRETKCAQGSRMPQILCN
jgi:hypothetical protein